MPQVSGSSLSQDQRKQKFLPTVICGHKSINPNLSSRLETNCYWSSHFNNKPDLISHDSQSTSALLTGWWRWATATATAGLSSRGPSQLRSTVCAGRRTPAPQTWPYSVVTELFTPSRSHCLLPFLTSDSWSGRKWSILFNISEKWSDIFQLYEATPVRLPSEIDLKFSGKFFSEQPNVK